MFSSIDTRQNQPQSKSGTVACKSVVLSMQVSSALLSTHPITALYHDISNNELPTTRMTPGLHYIKLEKDSDSNCCYTHTYYYPI